MRKYLKFFYLFFFLNRYFQCKQNHGIFVPFEKIKLVTTKSKKIIIKPDQKDNKHSFSSTSTLSYSSLSSSLELLKSISNSSSDTNKYTFKPIKSADISNNVLKQQSKSKKLPFSK